MKPVSATILFLLFCLLFAGWMFYSGTNEPVPQDVESRETLRPEQDRSLIDESIERFEAGAHKIEPSINKGADTTLDEPAR